MIADQFEKSVSEIFDYVIDMTKWLAAGETVASAEATTSPSTLEVASLTLSQKKVTIRLVNGEAGKRHSVAVYATISDGQIKRTLFAVQVVTDALPGTLFRATFSGFVDSTNPDDQDIYDLVRLDRYTAKGIYPLAQDGVQARYPCVVLPIEFGSPTFAIDGIGYGLLQVAITLLVDGEYQQFNIFVGDTPTFSTSVLVTAS